MRLRALSLALAPALLAGCVASGAINGQLTIPGAAEVPVALHYRSERFGLNGTVHTTLPSGETFSGRYLVVTSDTRADAVAPMWSGWGVGEADWGASDASDYGYGVEPADFPVFAQKNSGVVIATLLGDRGGHMRCRFRLDHPNRGVNGGGTGACQISGGGTIAAQF